ncbi:hypothetical protein BDZ97DRAFT_1791769 [Flammula alnicola]|nr:hypothetical protein BDZ97DRAFT_1791769 [Flammula alnicola]
MYLFTVVVLVDGSALESLGRAFPAPACFSARYWTISGRYPLLRRILLSMACRWRIFARLGLQIMDVRAREPMGGARHTCVCNSCALTPFLSTSQSPPPPPKAFCAFCARPGLAPSADVLGLSIAVQYLFCTNTELVLRIPFPSIYPTEGANGISGSRDARGFSYGCWLAEFHD